MGKRACAPMPRCPRRADAISRPGRSPAFVADGHPQTFRTSIKSRRCASSQRLEVDAGAIDSERGLDADARTSDDARERLERASRSRHAGKPARQRPDRGARTPGSASKRICRRWSTTSCSTQAVICWRSATTSASAGAMRVSTICWPPKRGWAASWRSRRGNCRRSTGLRWGGCSRPPAGEPVLLSWSGSMFEYLMPLLVMPTYENTLLDQTCKAAVRRQIEYGKTARRAVGHLGIRLQHHRCPPELSVPRVRRSRPGAQARPGRRPGHRAVCHGAGADGCARGGVREPAAAGRRGRRRPLRLLRGHRLHAVARAARTDRASSCGRSWRITRA